MTYSWWLWSIISIFSLKYLINLTKYSNSKEYISLISGSKYVPKSSFWACINSYLAIGLTIKANKGWIIPKRPPSASSNANKSKF